MIKVEFSPELREAAASALASLPAPADQAGLLRQPALVALKLIEQYYKSIPAVFAERNQDFFQNQTAAMEAGQSTDACQSLVALSSRMHSLQTAPATAANISFLRNLFECAQVGIFDLRKITRHP